jgi:hypothetical protein
VTRRLGLRFEEQDEALEEVEPFEVAALDGYAIRQDLVDMGLKKQNFDNLNKGWGIVDRNLEHRRRMAALYERLLAERGWPVAGPPPDTEPVLVRYPLRVADMRLFGFEDELFPDRSVLPPD